MAYCESQHRAAHPRSAAAKHIERQTNHVGKEEVKAAMSKAAKTTATKRPANAGWGPQPRLRGRFQPDFSLYARTKSVPVADTSAQLSLVEERLTMPSQP
jgi:hypothetical protein